MVVKMNLKLLSRIEYICGAVVVVSMATAGVMSYRSYQARKTQTTAWTNVVQAYDGKLIPLYQEKAKIISTFLVKSKISDKEIQPILSLTANWHAESLENVSLIEELNTHLDTHLSLQIEKLQKSQSSEKSLKVFLKDLESIDRKIRLARPESVAKN
jgi:hypothetical protein